MQARCIFLLFLLHPRLFKIVSATIFFLLQESVCHTLLFATADATGAKRSERQPLLLFFSFCSTSFAGDAKGDCAYWQNVLANNLQHCRSLPPAAQNKKWQLWLSRGSKWSALTKRCLILFFFFSTVKLEERGPCAAPMADFYPFLVPLK